MKNSFNKLFIINEFRSIIGKNWQHFWILFLVFLLTIFALEFSRSGLKYLSYKMNDPFINWIEVKEQADFERYMKDVEKHKSNFNISSIEANNYILEYVFNREFKKVRVEGRTISHDSRLLERIIESDNAITIRQRAISQTDYGWIVTKDLMNRLGYFDESNYPLFIYYTFPGDMVNLNNWGINNYNEYIIIPIPVIAVVNQLPDLLDFITPSFFMEQNVSESKPFNISMHEEYFNDILLAVENPNQNFENILKHKLDNSKLHYDKYIGKENFDLSLRSLTKYRIIIRDSSSHFVNKAVADICNDSSIYRIYDYAFNDGYKLKANYLSFMFSDLVNVPDFAKWSKEEYGIRIDMTQIETKENFNIFNILAWSLCIAISIIAISFIAIFLYFLIDSHFRRISKNLGTIMAFGLSNNTIIKIYLNVFIGLILISLSSVVAILYGMEKLLISINIVREGGLPWFSIIDPLVLIVVILLPIISAIVTMIFLRIKLNATPGDLIFERNN